MIIYVFAFILGSILGSFFHVVFSRKDWFCGRSRCDSCGEQLKWYDLIPVLSYISLGGRCRKCKAKIRPTHFISELIIGGAGVCTAFCFAQLPLLQALAFAVGLFFLSLSAIEDMIEQEIYSMLLYTGIALTGVIQLMNEWNTAGIYGAVEYVLWLLLVKGVLYLVSRLTKNQIGAGDFDIILIIYIMCGTYGCLVSIFYASFVGCLVYLPLIFLKKHGRKEPFPFVPYLLIGTIFYIFTGGAF